MFDLARTEASIGEAIDQAAFGAITWQELADHIRSHVPGIRVNLQCHDPSFDRPIILVASGWSASFTKAYVKHFAGVNEVGKVWPRAPALKPMRLPEAFMPLNLFRKSEFYNDCLTPEGEADCASGIKIFNDNGRQASICLQYGHRWQDQFHTALSPLLMALAPRMKRALEFNRISYRSSQGRLLQDDLIHNLLDAAFIVDGKRHILSANAAAEMMIEGDCALQVGAGDVLRLRNREANVSFDNLVRRACTGSADSLGEFEFAAEEPDTRFGVSIMPITQMYNFALRGTLPLFAPSFVALVVVRSWCACVRGAVEADLRSRYGLTSAEERVAKAIYQGGSMREIARKFGVSYETARNQLKAVFAKTDTHRQSELVALLSRLRA